MNARLPRRRPRALAVVTLLLALAFPTDATEPEGVAVYRRGDTLHVDLTARDLLDERTALTVDSGLPGTCLMHLRVEDRGAVAVAEQFIEWTLQFDLWENVYRLDGPTGMQTYATMAAADSVWSRLRGQSLCPAGRLHADRDYRVVVHVAVEPLAPEDRERLGRYVRRNAGGAGEELVLDLGATFSRLFGGGRRVEPPRSLVTPFFRTNELEVRP